MGQQNLTKEAAFELNEVSVREKTEGRTLQVGKNLKSRDPAEAPDRLVPQKEGWCGRAEQA